MTNSLDAAVDLDLIDDALLGSMLGVHRGEILRDGATVLGESHRGGVTRRYRLAEGGTLIFKRTRLPRTAESAAGSRDDEAAILEAVGKTGLPVATIYTVARVGGWLGMLLVDLGPATTVRPATVEDTASIAAWIHATEVPLRLPVLESVALAALPKQATDDLARLHTRHGTVVGPIAAALDKLRPVAEQRCASADQQPSGLCHGQLHPARIHRAAADWAVLGWSQAFSGPVLLDLAALHSDGGADCDWDTLLSDYVSSAGSSRVYDDCDGLDSGRWALGWHRIRQSVTAIADAADQPTPTTQPELRQIVSRLEEALRCLT